MSADRLRPAGPQVPAACCGPGCAVDEVEPPPLVVPHQALTQPTVKSPTLVIRIPVTAGERQGLASRDADTATAPWNGLHIGIATRGWETTLIVMVGVVIVVSAGVGALLIVRADDDRATVTTTPAPAEPGMDLPVVLRSGGLDRTYVVHVPASYDGSQAVPLVLVLHGSGGSAEIANRISGLSAKSDAAGFLAVYPQGTGTSATFNAGLCCGYAWRRSIDDVSFMRDVVADLSADYLVDARRIYAAGHVEVESSDMHRTAWTTTPRRPGQRADPKGRGGRRQRDGRAIRR